MSANFAKQLWPDLLLDPAKISGNRGIACENPFSRVVMMAGEEGIEPSLSRFWRPPLYR
jgi:hypothetical protein